MTTQLPAGDGQNWQQAAVPQPVGQPSLPARTLSAPPWQRTARSGSPTASRRGR